eukprot:TRINITY_DN4484_c0_g4_i1.p1 TRINITY_DN4484_c0_g4~~TRINITY_DN4484_c0_g4_i1.p1  ORF type:complete len:498 (+),score=182.65 TRINITY_DN4484_c0_g4_i1:165-1658(+)
MTDGRKTQSHDRHGGGGIRLFAAGTIAGLVFSACVYGYLTATSIVSTSVVDAEAAKLLRRVGLAQYVPSVVVRGGYETVDDVRRAGAAGLERLGMKPGHALRLWAAVAPPSPPPPPPPPRPRPAGRQFRVAGVGSDGVPGLYSPWLERPEYDFARDPRTNFSHHPVFRRWAAVAAAPRPSDEGVLEDFAGVRTLREYDCNATSMYYKFHLSRSVPCEEQARALRGEEWHPAKALWPIADEEYFEYVDVLLVVLRAVRERRPFTMLELGARYGTWVTRAAVAYRALAKAEKLPTKARVTGVEADRDCWAWMEKHFEHNRVEGQSVWGYLDVVDGQLRAIERSFSGHRHAYTSGRDRTPTVSVQTLLKRHEYVDLIDMDVQGFEYQLMMDSKGMSTLASKVAYLHIGTHVNRMSEKMLISALTRKGFCILLYFPGTFSKQLSKQKWKYTPYGLMKFNDGVIFAENRRFSRDPSRPCHRDFEKEVVTYGYWDPRMVGDVL